MKKRTLKSLSLNKKSISNLTKSSISGGRTNSVTCASICLEIRNPHHYLAYPKEAEQATIPLNAVSMFNHETCWNC